MRQGLCLPDCLQAHQAFAEKTSASNKKENLPMEQILSCCSRSLSKKEATVVRLITGPGPTTRPIPKTRPILTNRSNFARKWADFTFETSLTSISGLIAIWPPFKAGEKKKH